MEYGEAYTISTVWESVKLSAVILILVGMVSLVYTYIQRKLEDQRENILKWTAAYLVIVVVGTGASGWILFVI